MAWKKQPGAILGTLLFIHVIAHIDRNMLLGFSAQITADLGLNHTQYGLLVGAVWVFSYSAMAIVMGTLADRFSRTRIVAIGLLVWSLCTAASGSAGTFGQMVAARFLVACGEAALVPAAVALLAEVFSERRRGSAIGVFFMGIPLGVGCSFLLAGSVGVVYGWRSTFYALGVVGVVAGTLIACLRDDRSALPAAERGAPFAEQLRDVLAVWRGNASLQLAIGGFVMVHMLFVSLSFAQIWLVRERGMDVASVTRAIGGVQIVFGTLGSLAGGLLGDRFARRFRAGHAGFMALLVLLCAPLMIAFRLAPAGSPLFYAGMCAGAFLPLALYGPALATIQGNVPVRMRSTISGVTMTLINVLVIALGNFAVGAISDRLAGGSLQQPLTYLLLATDLIAAASVLCFLALALRGPVLAAPDLSAGEVR